MNEERGYRREYLRAPFRQNVLYCDQDFVFKARAMNISEGGLLLDQVPYFPQKGKVVPLMLALAQYPYFKNFDLEKLENYSTDLLRLQVIRLGCEVVRKREVKSQVEEVFSSRVGAKFIDLSVHSRQQIKNYVEILASNLVYLHFLMDNLNADEINLKKFRALARILNYDSQLKVSQLRTLISVDYANMQWL